MALKIQFYYKREVYYKRLVQVACPVISLLQAKSQQRVSKNVMLRKTVPSTDKLSLRLS